MSAESSNLSKRFVEAIANSPEVIKTVPLAHEVVYAKGMQWGSGVRTKSYAAAR